MSTLIAIICLALAGVATFVAGIYLLAGLGPALLAIGVALFAAALLLRSGMVTNV